MRKLRVMVCGEASFLATGFGTYSLELLKRLHDSGRYELLEYACYSPPGDRRAADLPWAHRSAMPEPGDVEAQKAYEADPSLQFGALRFEEVCLDFQPDVVVDFRDHWMMRHELTSPFRRFYQLAWMPTVDAEPQSESWLADYLQADALFTYSDWALELLRRQGGERMPLRCSAPAGADFAAYQVRPDKRAHRARFGMDPDALVVGTIMRNQRRKLYPELLGAFGLFLSRAPAQMARRSYLYLHTAWPDVGWDLPRLVLESGLSSRTLFSHHCRACGGFCPGFFRDSRAYCRLCGAFAAGFPTTQVGVNRRTLGEVLSLFDVYVQYANSEGQGMPQVEAAAAGLTVMATDYSAMSDVVRKVKGIAVKPLVLLRELETHCKRAVPDPDDFASKLIEHLSLPESVRAQKGWQARRGAQEHYDWDQTAGRWMEYLDSLSPPEQSTTWGSPPSFHTPVESVPGGLNDLDFVRWGMKHVAGRPDLADSYQALRMARDLSHGFTIGGMGEYFNEASHLGSKPRTTPFGREQAWRVLAAMAAKRNRWESQRAGRMK